MTFDILFVTALALVFVPFMVATFAAPAFSKK